VRRSHSLVKYVFLTQLRFTIRREFRKFDYLVIGLDRVTAARNVAIYLTEKLHYTRELGAVNHTWKTSK